MNINDIRNRLNKTSLRKVQKDVVETVFNALEYDQQKILVELAPGSGKTAIIQTILTFLTEEEDSNNGILVLVNDKAALESMTQALQNANLPFSRRIETSTFEYDITLATQRAFLHDMSQSLLKEYNIIICADAGSMQSYRYADFFDLSDAHIIGFFNAVYGNSDYNWFSDVKPVYSNTPKKEALIYYQETDALDFLIDLFHRSGINKIEKKPKVQIDKQEYRPDLIMEKDDNLIYVELKTYRGPTVYNYLLDIAATQLLRYKQNFTEIYAKSLVGKKPAFYLAVLCLVDPNLKSQYLRDHDIHILDVADLLYLTQSDSELYKRLTQMLPYPVDHIPSSKPDSPLLNILEFPPEETEVDIPSISLIDKLRQCKTGKNAKAASQYEQICNEIIHYLFAPEFSKEIRQFKTFDRLFRMDLLCALKGTTALWNFLIRFFNTNFVVFEYKNYGSKITQNLIYITEKYLFDAALRNVAFIISRKGFDRSAQIAASGCLKEHKKLIIDLTDDDLIKMIRIKEDGEEPSDYLLSKIEDYLMSIGK